jgi:hypothetical protein
MKPFFPKADGHAIATRSNFLRFGKRDSNANAIDEVDEVNQVFQGPNRRDYREFVRWVKIYQAMSILFENG